MHTTPVSEAMSARSGILSLDLFESILLLTQTPLPIAAACSSLAALALDNRGPLRLAWLRRSMAANTFFQPTGISGSPLDDDGSFGFFNRYLLRNSHFVPDLLAPLDALKPNPFPPAFVSWLLHAPRWFPLPPPENWIPTMLSAALQSPDDDQEDKMALVGGGGGSAHLVTNLVLILRLPLMYMYVGRFNDLAQVLHMLCQRCPDLLEQNGRCVCEYGALLDYQGGWWGPSMSPPLEYIPWLHTVAEEYLFCVRTGTWEGAHTKQAKAARLEACLKAIKSVVANATSAGNQGHGVLTR